jgi:hypothetical protein
MNVATYNHECSHCNQTYEVKQSWIDPKIFTTPDKAHVTSSFWCQKCEKGQAVKLLMLPEQKVEVVENMEYRSMVKENSPLHYSPPSNDSEDPEREDRIESITEDKALKILSALN